MNNINVLMVGSETKIKGGMTTVVNNYLNNKFKYTTIKYIPTHYEGNTLRNVLKFIKKIPELKLNIKNADIIHMHMSERGSCIRKYIVYKIAKKNNKKVITHMHGAEFGEYYENASDFIKSKVLKLLKGSDYVLTLGENWNKYVTNMNEDINSVILKNSVEVPNVNVVLKEHIFNILFLAVIEKRKGIYELVESAKLLIDMYKGNKKFKFIIAGSGTEETNVKKIIKQYNIEEYFEFKGWVNDDIKKDLLKNSHLFILPSYNEGLPVAILEAMSYGLPIISTDVGSINEAVKNGKNGYLLDSVNPYELSIKMVELINDTERWSQMSKESKRMCISNFEKGAYFKNIEKIYEELSRY